MRLYCWVSQPPCATCMLTESTWRYLIENWRAEGNLIPAPSLGELQISTSACLGHLSFGVVGRGVMAEVLIVIIQGLK